ncbi:methylcobamide--CoM methyltransferase [bacterium]|nr:methylcobamide--CoM methyltransferase [bacterium]
MTQTQRLLAALRREPTDRPPVICPGGMMSVATVEAMDLSGCHWPQAHCDLDQMVRLALAVTDEGGMENLAVPFCMTVEAEALGAEVDFGDRLTQPRVSREPCATSQDLLSASLSPIADSPRAQVVLQAMRQLRTARPGTPVLGNLVGPMSLAASLVQPDRFLKEMIREPRAVAEVLERLSDLLAAFGQEQIAAGAEVMVIADPTATGEIVGPRLFERLVLPPLSRLIQALRAAGSPVIVHVCGNVMPLAPLLPRLEADCVSVDAVVSLRRLRGELPDMPLMGNLDALVLEAGPPERIAHWTRHVGLRRADIIAPACAVVPTTPLAHLRALAQAARDPIAK